MIVVFKVLDIALQLCSLIIPLLTHYFFTYDAGVLIFTVGGTQLVSLIVNLFVLKKKYWSVGRIWFFILLVLLVLYFIIIRNVNFQGAFTYLNYLFFVLFYVCPFVGLFYLCITIHELMIIKAKCKAIDLHLINHS